MSYADVVIERTDATVDDEYQRSLLHKSYTYGFTMLTWANYALAAVLIWLIPEEKMFYATVAINMMPLFASKFPQQWLRHRVPLRRVNSLTKTEAAALIVILCLWLSGVARMRWIVNDDALGHIVSIIIGIIAGLAFVYFLFKVIWSAARNRDQRHLDRELDEEDDAEK